MATFTQRRRIPDCYSKRRHRSSYEVLKTNLIMFLNSWKRALHLFSSSHLSTLLSIMGSESFISLRSQTFDLGFFFSARVKRFGYWLIYTEEIEQTRK